MKISFPESSLIIRHANAFAVTYIAICYTTQTYAWGFTSYVRVRRREFIVYVQMQYGFRGVCIFLLLLSLLCRSLRSIAYTSVKLCISFAYVLRVEMYARGMCLGGVANFTLILQVRLTARDTCLYPPRMFHSR